MSEYFQKTLANVQIGMPQQLPVPPPRFPEKNGVVYTKPWVVDVILDLAGYSVERDLASLIAVEPAAGDGAFLVAMVQRLVDSCRTHRRPIAEATTALLAYELDDVSAEHARIAVQRILREQGVGHEEADRLAATWIRVGDYLMEAQELPAADFVIGNPPYIRLEDMDDTVAANYRAMYRTMRGRADIYVAFFEAALRQLKVDGVCAFICADRWMLNQYGTELRRFVTRGFGVEVVVEMHNADAFLSDVSAYPAVTVIRRSAQGPAVVASAKRDTDTSRPHQLASWLRLVRLNGNGFDAPPGLQAARIESWFQDADPWPCIAPKRLALLKHLERQFQPLESEETKTKVGIGVATGADDVFITTDPGLVEPSRLLPLAMAYDVVDGRLHWSGHYLVNPWTVAGLVNLSQFPRLKAYFEGHQSALKNRHVGKRSGDLWYRTIDRVNHHLTEKPKLYIPDIKDRIEPVFDAGETYPHHNLYFVQSDVWDHQVLGGLLLSAVGQFFVECYGVRMRGGYLRFQAQYLRRIRVPHPSQISAKHQTLLAEAFVKRDRALATTVALEVYQLRELPEADE